MVGSHNHDIEGVAGGHAGVTSLPCANRQRARGIVPADGDEGMRALLIAVAVALVFIEVETAVGSGVEAQLDGISGLARILDDRPQGQN
jgi:NCAIR mutase (PurE)-related protein